MTAARQLITDAFREGNLIPVGKAPTADEATEALGRLNAYQLGIFGYELGEKLMDWPVPVPQRTAPVAANFPQLPYPANTDALFLGTPFAADLSNTFVPYPPANSRIIFGNVTSTVYFPEAPEDGARMAIAPGSGAGDNGVSGAVLTLNGNGRTIEGALTKTYAASGGPPPAIAPRQWIYRADLADWKAIAVMAIDDPCPFPAEFDDLWVCYLQIRLGPRFGKPASMDTKTIAIQMLERLKTRYRQTAPTTYGAQDFPRSYQSYIAGQWFVG